MSALVTDVCDRCGNLRSVCSDPSIVAYPQRSVCYLTAVAEQMYRRSEKVYGHPDPDDGSPHALDGLQWWASLTDITPDDDFFGEALLARSSEQAVGEKPEADQSEQHGP